MPGSVGAPRSPEDAGRVWRFGCRRAGPEIGTGRVFFVASVRSVVTVPFVARVFAKHRYKCCSLVSNMYRYVREVMSESAVAD